MRSLSSLPMLLGVICLWSAAAVAADTPAAPADKPAAKAEKPTAVPAAKDPQLEVIELQLQPAALPRPALKYRFTPSFLDQTSDNAALLYEKAFIMLAEQKLDNETWDKIAKWLDMPPADLPVKEVATTLSKFNGVLQQTEMGARRPYCRWELPFREQRDIFAMLLPELQSARSVGRILALKARLQIAEKKYDEAVDTLRSGYTLARHVAEEPVLIASLVGIAIASMIDGQVQTLAQTPGAPNMYWALTALPTPLVDCRKSLDFEGVGIYLLIPELQPRERTKLSAEQWQAWLLTTTKRLKTLLGESDAEASVIQELKQFAEAAYWASLAPRAKADLIAMGYPAKTVEEMSPAQAIAWHVAAIYDDLRDELFKWFNVPYWQAHERLAKAEKEIGTVAKKRELIPVASLLLPAVGRAYFATVRLERQIAALRCIEALRAYAASHEGKLPATLDAIADVAIPLNPVTGKPFPYKLEGDTATLEADGPKDLQRTKYVLRIGK